MTETKTSLQKVIDALLDRGKDFPRRYLHEFSDIDPAALQALLKAWPRIQSSRKRLLLEELRSLADADTLVCFDDLGRALLKDDDPQVRTRAIRLLDECGDVKLIPAYIDILSGDQDAASRAEAAAALGQFVQLGEFEEIPEMARHQVEEALLRKVNGEDRALVRRRALESLGYSSRPEVPTLIESAFGREDPDWQASALFAMGHSSDERWQEQVIGMLINDDPRIRLAAVQAAGELGLTAARAVLLRLLEEEEDDDIFAAAIWSLSQIGGEDARIYLQSLLDQADDDGDARFLEEALENLAFTEDLSRFDLISFDATDEE